MLIDRFKSNISQIISFSLSRIPSISLLKSSKHLQTNRYHYKHSNIISKPTFINIDSPIFDQYRYLDYSNIIKPISIHSIHIKNINVTNSKFTKKRSIDLEPVYDYVEIISLDVTRTIAQRAMLFSVTFSRQPALCRSTKVTVSVLTLTRKLDP